MINGTEDLWVKFRRFPLKAADFKWVFSHRHQIWKVTCLHTNVWTLSESSLTLREIFSALPAHRAVFWAEKRGWKTYFHSVQKCDKCPSFMCATAQHTQQFVDARTIFDSFIFSYWKILSQTHVEGAWGPKED